MDRNSAVKRWAYCNVMSLSARRAWIEILAYPDMIICTNVALRKESVDRNIGVGTTRASLGGRSPQGERG